MQCLEVSGAVRPLQGSLGFKGLTATNPSSSFPMHYSLITLLWECTESALLKAIFINHTHTHTHTHTHMDHKLCSRIDYFPVMVSLGTKWAGHVAHMENRNI